MAENVKKKKWILWIVIIAVLIIAAVVAVMLFGNGYRVIKVKDFEGDVTLERASKEKELFEGLHLKSEDTITTGADGLLELLVDEDKHILAKEDTCFTIQSSGNDKKGKLKIELEYGTNLIEIENKLPEGYQVEVKTPNATLSVRGTTFEVEYIKETNTTILQVTEGAVVVTTKVEFAEIEAGGSAIITGDDIEWENVILYGDTTLFEVMSLTGDRGSAIYARQLVGWEYVNDTSDGYVINEFKKDGVSIRYCISTSKEMDEEVMPIIEAKGGLPVYQNGDGATVTAITYDVQDESGNKERAYRYYKKLAEEMYLNIYVYGGDALLETSMEDYVDLTMNCYYVYGLAKPIEQAGTNESAGENVVETPVIEDVSYPTYIDDEQWPELLKGGSNFYQLEYLLKIAQISKDEGHDNYLKTALYWMCYESYSTGIYTPIEGTENTYDISELNKLFSFLTDEQIGEEHLNPPSTISGNQVTCVYTPTTHEISTNMSIVSAYYGESEEIIVEYSYMVVYLTGDAVGTFNTLDGVAHLVKDETGKYVLDYLE